ncbi:MAG: type I-U CRISPR-associated protein Csx17 [Acidobacteria bacterium]|nr:type I-U CRISPR-associated protein Csx17 [Acidobacteriota bacterium]
MATLQLHGCAPEPLGDYLKALGVFRLVSEQISAEVRCWWKHGVFHLWLPDNASFRIPAGEAGSSCPVPWDEAARRAWLETFLLEACEFSPFLAPWQKNTAVLPYDRQKKAAKKAKAGEQGKKTIDRDRAAQRALSAVLQHSGPGTSAYRSAIRDFAHEFSLTVSSDMTKWVDELKGIDDPPLFEALNTESEQGRNIGRKSAAQARLIERTRNASDDRRVTTWLDTVGHPKISTNRFRKERQWFSLLGDGAAEGSGGMIMRLYTALADVLSRRSADARQWLATALWGVPGNGNLSYAYSIGLFYPSRKETPNSGQGFESGCRGAAWDVVLLFEGVLLFAGSMARRMNARKATPAFPFYCASSLGGNPAAGATEIEGSPKGISSGEAWCPVWNQPATLRDLTALFSEGRIQVSGHDARLATQFVRALGRHGCDRGIAAFQRYGLLRRSGSFGKKDQTSTLAVPLGLYGVSPDSDLELLNDVLDYEEGVLDASGRWAIVNSDSQPRRIVAARRRLEEAIFDASRVGLQSHRAEDAELTTDLPVRLMKVAVAVAALECECAITDGRIHDREGKMPDRKDGPNVPCAPSLSYDWLRLKHVAPSNPPKLADLWDDGTTEWRLARAVGTICAWGKRSEHSRRPEASAVGPIRENLVRAVRAEQGASWKWEPESGRAVWLRGHDILINCASVLQRRLIDAHAGSGKGLPLFSPYGAGPSELLALWQGEMDDGRLGELLHAFALIRPWRPIKVTTPGVVGDVVFKDGNSNSDNTAFHADSDDQADMTSAWLARLDAAAQLPRAYALLKLCFLGGRLPPRPGQARNGAEPHAPGNLHILDLLMAGRGEEACTAAARRLHEVGYPPLFATSRSFSAGFVLSTADCCRLAGLLLVPITFAADLARLIIRPTREDNDDRSTIAEHATV